MKRVILAAIVLIASVAPVQAGDTEWTAGIGNWSTASNWDNGEPGPDDDARISNGGTAQITAANDEACTYLHLAYRFSSDSGTVDMTGGSLSVGSARIGYRGDGTLNIAGGGVVSSSYGSLGGYSGAIGTVTVDGAGSTWTNGLHLWVGGLYGAGEGTLDITAGGTVSNADDCYIAYGPGSTGAVTVDGAGSTWTNSANLYVGRDGAATLDITNGAEVTVEDVTWVSRYSGTGAINFDNGTLTTGGFGCAVDDLAGTGTINTAGIVSDVNLVFDAAHGLSQTFTINDDPGRNITVNLDVDGLRPMGAGYGGVGTMSISDGMIVGSTDGYVGFKPGSDGGVTVDGVGSTWTNSADLHVGREGHGTLDITGGAAVSNSWGFIGYLSGGTGAVTVDGAGSTWTNSDNLYVGGKHDSDGGGNGTLDITGGGTVINEDGHVGYGQGSTGAVTVDGGSTWTNNRSLNVGRRGDGTLEITGGGTVSSDRGTIAYDDGTTGAVTVDGAGSTWTNNTYLEVGAQGDGTLNITNGGEVTVGIDTTVSRFSGSSGTVSLDDGTLTTGGLLCTFEDLTGTGTINAHGLVSDADLVFDAAHGLSQVLTIDANPGQNVTLNLDVDGAHVMGAGFRDHGTMSISEGRTVECTDGYIGYRSGSTGAVTVDGAGSTWTSTSDLYVGYEGAGTLSITGGAALSCNGAIIGRHAGSTGEVTVNGDGSTWTNNDLYVGLYGAGTLNITGGGLVSVAGTLTIKFWTDDDCYVNMASYGMLALSGDAEDSLADFLVLIDGPDAIRYWNNDISGWDDITNGTMGEDYWLTYLAAGDLAGYTVLTVPEPATLGMLSLGGLTLLRRRKRK